MAFLEKTARVLQTQTQKIRNRHRYFVTNFLLFVLRPSNDGYTITYRVFHHVLLITKLHYIYDRNCTDGIHGSKGMLRGYLRM